MNKAKPDVIVNLDRPRALLLDLNAMCKFEKVAGRSLFDGSALGSNMSASDIRVLLWACLLRDDPTLTLEQVGSLISVNNMAEVASKLNESFEAAIPDKTSKAVASKAKEKIDRPLSEIMTG